MNAHDFTKGTRWEVIRDGARLWGWKSCGQSSWQGFNHALHVGDVIESRGVSMTSGDGMPALKWSDPEPERGGFDILFEPCTGVSAIPADGYLEEVPS